MSGLREFPFEVKNEWFSGQAAITTYDPAELLGTKLRALYQRKKGRDLFDLYYADRQIKPDWEKIIHVYRAYMRSATGKLPTTKEFLRNLEVKETDADFLGDMEGLIRPDVEYNPQKAFAWIKERILEWMA